MRKRQKGNIGRHREGRGEMRGKGRHSFYPVKIKKGKK